MIAGADYVSVPAGVNECALRSKVRDESGSPVRQAFGDTHAERFLESVIEGDGDMTSTPVSGYVGDPTGEGDGVFEAELVDQLLEAVAVGAVARDVKGATVARPPQVGEKADCDIDALSWD